MPSISSAQDNAPTSAPPTAQGGQSGFTFPKVDAKTWMLPNGMAVIVKEDKAAPVASVQAWVKVGSVFEDDMLGAGVSHLVEHMVFKGTKTRETGAIAQSVQDEGGYMNAYTSFDRTVYYIDTPKGGVSNAINVIADMMMNATMPEEEFAKERKVVEREYDMGRDDPGRTSSKLMFSTVFREHPYQHSVIGHMDVFDAISREDAMAFYKRHYVPNNMFFVVVGDVDADKVYEEIKTYFEPYPRIAYQPIYIPEEPRQLGQRERHAEFETKISKLDMSWRIPSLTHPDMPALDVLSSIVGDGRTSRLNLELREKQALVHGISAYSYTPAWGGLFGVSASVDPDKRDQAQSEILKLLAEVKANGVTEAEVAKAMKASLSSQIATLTTVTGQAQDIGGNYLSTGNIDFTGEYLTALSKVSAEDVKRVANKYLVNDALSITSLNPKGTLAKSKESTQAAPLEDIQRHELSNGITLLLRKDSRLPLVAMQASFQGGLLAEPADKNGVSSLFAKTLIKGTSTQSAEQVAAALENVGGSIGSMSGNNSYAVSVGVMKEDTALGLKQLAAVVLDPAFPEQEIAKEKASQIAGIKQSADRLMNIGNKALREYMFAGHGFARQASGTEESVTNLTRDDLVAWHQKTVTTRNCVIAVFGDIEPEAIKAEIEKAFATMPDNMADGNTTGGRLLANLAKDAAPVTVAAKTMTIHKDKSQAVLMVGYPVGTLYNEDRYALDLLDEACSDMASRLFTRIREEQGLAYYVGSSQLGGLEPGAFYFYLGTSPQQLEHAQAELLDEINNMATKGLTELELKRAKKTYLGKKLIQLQSSAALAQSVALDELYELGADYHKGVEAKVEAVTLEDINKVCAKYLDAKSAVVVRVMPEPAEKKEEATETP